ncbi:MAG: ArsR family transcriptional regulator [Candidatus Bathyarchaeota archaeon]|jgi:DNA-binding MarR family transcriptional regulator
MGEAMDLQLEDFGSLGLLKVMEIITRHGPLNISTLMRRAGMNHSNVDRHVKNLVEMWLVTAENYISFASAIALSGLPIR